MHRLLLLLILVTLTSGSFGQQTQDSVKAAVNKLFVAMKQADSATLVSSFTDSAILQTIAKNKDGKVIIRNETVGDFAHMIATIEKDAADERIVFESIKIDADLASVWTPYNFYFKGKFSHCGVNSFQLVRVDNIWKINYLIDTRRKQGCAE